MKTDKNTLADAAELRRLAEERLREKRKSQRSEVGGLPAITLAKAGQRTEEETQRLLHELQVHQIELEMQNEELRQSRAEVEAGLERYTDLYDFAPVGYFTLDRNGAISQVNLTGVRLLAVERARLVNRRFGLFVSDDSRPAFAAFLQKVFESQAKETCEVALLKEGNHPPSSRLSGGQEYGEAGPLSVRIEATVSEDGQECRAVVVDITERKRAEEALRRYANRLGALRQIDRAILAAQSPQAIAEAALKHIRRMIPCQRASVVLFDEEAQERVVLAADTDGPTEVDTGSRAPLERGDVVPCLRRGEAYLVPDLQALSAPTLVEAALRAEGIRTRLSLPLSAQGNLLGALNFGATTVVAFTPEDVEIAREVTDQLAVVLQQARLHAAAVRRGEELAALLRAARTVMSGLDLQTTLERIIEEAAQIAGTPHVQVLLVEKGARVLRVAALHGMAAWHVGFVLPVGTSLSGLAAQTRQPVFSENLAQDPRNLFAQQDRELGLVTHLSLPIKLRDELLGVLTFKTTAPCHYTPDEVAYLTSFADHAAIAIENARLYEATVRQLKELKALYDTGQAITSSLSLDEQLGLLVERLSQATGAQRVLVGLGDAEDTRRLRLCLAYDASKADPWLRQLDLSPKRYPEIQEVMRTGRPLVIPEVVTEPLLAPVRDHLAPLDLCSMVVMPLIVQERAIGAISLGYVGQGRTFTDDEVRLLQSFATQAAIAIEKARLFAAAEQRAGELSILREIDQAITARLELPAVLEALVAGALRLLGTQHAEIGLWDETGQTLRHGAALGTDGEWLRARTYERGRGINATVVLTRQPMILDEYQASPYALPELANVRATLTVPILFEGRLLGVLHSHTTQPDRRFTPDDLRRFQMLASQAAIAIENAQLYEAVQRHAAELEVRVQERTRELAAANQQLEAASRHKSEFLANMSHELRTPLNSILGFSQLLLEQTQEVLPAKQIRFLSNIHNSGQHLLQLINDILDLSKVEANKFILQPEPLPVAATLEDILVIGRGLANKKGQLIETEIAPGLPPLQADPVRFKQILFNLLSNAIKFTPEKGTITLRAYQKAEGRKQKAESREQKAEGREQKAESRRQRAPGSGGGIQAAYCRLPTAFSRDRGDGHRGRDQARGRASPFPGVRPARDDPGAEARGHRPGPRPDQAACGTARRPDLGRIRGRRPGEHVHGRAAVLRA